jgi:hypothetical protein
MKRMRKEYLPTHLEIIFHSVGVTLNEAINKIEEINSVVNSKYIMMRKNILNVNIII